MMVTLGAAGGANTYTATVAGLTGSPLTFNAAAAKNIAVSAGNNQGGLPSAALANPLVVKVTDNAATGVDGITVAWTFAGGGAGQAVSLASVVTAGGGFAQVTATLGATAGPQTFTASVVGLAGSPVVFTGTAATTMSLSSGDAQNGTASAPLANPLAVLVTDGTNPVAGVSVAWTVQSGGGTIPSPSVTNASGIATSTPTLGATAGANAFRATVAGLAGSPVDFTATGFKLPVFNGALTFTPNVMLGGAAAPQYQFSLPPLTAGTAGSASSVALTVTPAGGTTSAPLTKHDTTAILPADLGGAAFAVDGPTTSAGAASKIYTYALTATNTGGGAAGTSAPANATLDVYPPSVTLTGNRVGATATLLTSGPNIGKVLIVGGGTSTASSGLGTTALALGVCTQDAASSTAELYDPATGSTTSAGTMKYGHCLHTAVQVGGKVYVMGGVKDATASNDVRIDVYTVATGTWQSPASGLPVLQAARYAHTATLVPSGANAGKIIVAGGYNPVGDAGLVSIELFDPAGPTSTTYTKTGGSGPTALSIGRGDSAAALAGTWLYIIGGADGAGNYSNSIDAIDTTLPANNGTNGGQVNHTPQPTNGISRVAHAALGLTSTTILVAGGIIDNTPTFSPLMQVYTVDGSGNVTGISAGTNMTTARARFTLLPAGPANKYLAFGGVTALANPDTGTNSLELLTNTAGTLSTASGGTMLSNRVAAAPVNLAVAGATNFVFLVAGGAAAAGAGEVVIGP